MLANDVVFILGAAFSAEMGMPLGFDLKTKIANALPPGQRQGGDLLLRNQLNALAKDDFLEASFQLRRALPLSASIDNLVEHFSDDAAAVAVAKWAIARIIAAEEAGSHLGGGNPDIPVPADTAYGDLFRLIVNGVPKRNLDEAFSRLKVVTFNYDRTLEVFFVRALCQHSGLSGPEARKVFSRATIYHAYGSLQASARQSSRFDEMVFAGWEGWRDLEAMAGGIRTFSEEMDSASRAEIGELIQYSGRLVFMGCAFHKQNLQLIRPKTIAAQSVFATAYVPAPRDPGGHAIPSLIDFSQPAIRSLRSAIMSWDNSAGLYAPAFHLEAMTCRQLIALYGTSWLA